jgi:RecB family exonuclease
LRLAFGTVTGGHWVGTPATRLGSAIHTVLGDAAQGKLGTPEANQWRDRFDTAWRQAVKAEEDELAAIGASWPTATRWPGYATGKALTMRLAASVANELHEADVLVEQPMTSREGWLRGRPDVVVRAPTHEIRDFKTGRVHGSEGTVHAPYRLQLELYAVLERDATGELPDALVLIPLEGNPVRWPAQSKAIRATELEAHEALVGYNASVAAEEVAALGSPNPDACRWCRWAAKCPAFHTAYEATWWPDVAVVNGTVQETTPAARGMTALSVVTRDGTPTRIAGIDRTTHERLAEALPGEAVSVVGGAWRPGGSVAMTRSARFDIQS